MCFLVSNHIVVKFVVLSFVKINTEIIKIIVSNGSRHNNVFSFPDPTLWTCCPAWSRSASERMRGFRSCWEPWWPNWVLLWWALLQTQRSRWEYTWKPGLLFWFEYSGWFSTLEICTSLRCFCYWTVKGARAQKIGLKSNYLKIWFK